MHIVIRSVCKQCTFPLAVWCSPELIANQIRIASWERSANSTCNVFISAFHSIQYLLMIPSYSHTHAIHNKASRQCSKTQRHFWQVDTSIADFFFVAIHFHAISAILTNRRLKLIWHFLRECTRMELLISFALMVNRNPIWNQILIKASWNTRDEFAYQTIRYRAAASDIFGSDLNIHHSQPEWSRQRG